MDQLKGLISGCLKEIKGGGKFISVGEKDFLFPGLNVDGVGEISYPVNDTQAKALVQVAQRAPYGKGSQTLHDISVRNTWEIDPEKLTFTTQRWTGLVNRIMSHIKPDLGLEDYTISAHLYKMLIYEKGGFFLPHKDSEKEKGMFGTLVISLPSSHTGGELVVSFGGVEEVASFSENSGDYKINYAAFYADCDHEIKPVTSGHRICLVYNLVQHKSSDKIQYVSTGKCVDKLAKILKEQKPYQLNKPLIVLLGHQYTPENFALDTLKLDDRPKADVLVSAARKAGYYVKMCLVTSYQAGTPAYDSGYDFDDYGEYEDYDGAAVMSDVYEDSLYVEHWLESDVPALSTLELEEEDLIASFSADEDEPIVKEATGYMGNYGPDLMHWYHYGAVVMWTKQLNAQLLPKQNIESKLQWIDYFNNGPLKPDDLEAASIDHILSGGFSEDSIFGDPDFNPIADWIINRKNEDFFSQLDPQVLQLYFTGIAPAHWVKLIGFVRLAEAEKIFTLVTRDINLPVTAQLLAVLRALSATGKFDPLVVSQIKRAPQYFTELAAKSAKKEFPTAIAAVRDLIWIEEKFPQDETWVQHMTEALTGQKERDYVNEVLIPQLLEVDKSTPFSHRLLLASRQHLQGRVNSEPRPPVDWSRKVPSSTRYKKQWDVLKTFMASPVQQVFDYRVKQGERNEMERAIKSVVIDLKTETFKVGSPHTLRITKTKAAFHRDLKKWEEDKELLRKVVRKAEQLKES